MDDDKDLISTLEVLSLAGNEVAQYMLAIIYMSENEHKDYDKAMRWLRKSAMKGYPEAQCGLGVIYLAGLDGVVQRDVSEAFKWLEKAAAQNFPQAFYYLGSIYMLEEDYQNMVKNLKQAAELGVAEAQLYMGLFYTDGSIVEKDEEKASYWLDLFARQKDSNLNQREKSEKSPITAEQSNPYILLDHEGVYYASLNEDRFLIDSYYNPSGEERDMYIYGFNPHQDKIDLTRIGIESIQFVAFKNLNINGIESVELINSLNNEKLVTILNATSRDIDQHNLLFGDVVDDYGN